MEHTDKIFAAMQLALCALAFVGFAVLSAVHIVEGNIATPGGYAFCLAMLLALRWLTLKSWEQLKAINN